MFISPETVQNFKKMYKEQWNEEVSDAIAYEAALNLLGFFSLLWKIDCRLKKEKGGKNELV